MRRNAMIVRATTSKTAGREAGLSLVEILIAMFVFMVGILGVLSLFPVAMSSASKAIGEVRTNTLAESAISQLTVDCHAPVDSGTPLASTESTLVREATQLTDRTGYFVTMTAGPAKGQSRLITSCSTNTLNIFPIWDPVVTPAWAKPGDDALNDRYIVTRLGLPDVRDEDKPRDGFVRELPTTGANVFYAGRPDPGGEEVKPCTWTTTLWDPNSSAAQTVTGQSNNTVNVSGSPWVADAQKGKFVLVHQMNSSTGKPSPARGQIRLVIANTTSQLTVFPDWSTQPETDAEIEIRDVPGYFILFTNGRLAGRILPIIRHELDATKGDKFTLPDGVDLAALGVTQALRADASGTPEALTGTRRATSFIILGSNSVLSTVLPNQNYLLSEAQINGTDFPPAKSYFFNSFGFGKDAEPQTGADIFHDTNPESATATIDRVASEYSAVCIFSNNGIVPSSSIVTPLHTLPVRVDVLVFLSYAQSKSPLENRKAVGYMTGYIERP